jgi:hypothetical protein
LLHAVSNPLIFALARFSGREKVSSRPAGSRSVSMPVVTKLAMKSFKSL